MEDTTQQTTQVADVGAASGGFAIPQEYSSRGWASEGKISSYNDLFKAYDNAQSLIGKRSIPSDASTPEEWDSFYKQMGRPDTADKYGLDKIEGVPEGFDLSPYEAKFKNLAHKVGLTPRQANQAWREYVGMELGAYGDSQKLQAEKEAEREKSFNDLSSKLFGDKFDVYSKQAQSDIGEAIPQGLIDWGDMPSEYMMGFVSMSKYYQEKYDAIKAKYGAEDILASGGQNKGMSVDEVRAELVKANSELQKAKIFSPEFKQIEENRNKLRETLSRMVNK